MERPRSTPVEPATQQVLRAVAAYSGRSVLELPPLYDAVDPDSLDDLVKSVEKGRVRFRYAGHDVTLYEDGTVDISSSPPDDHEQAEAAADD